MGRYATPPKDVPCNIRRAWRVTVLGHYGEGSSASVNLGMHLVSLRADAHGTITAKIDGAPAAVHAADDLLHHGKRHGTLTLIEDVRE